ncbi:MAG: hypothetical protein ACOVN9_10830 [Inhella sp.]
MPPAPRSRFQFLLRRPGRSLLAGLAALLLVAALLAVQTQPQLPPAPPGANAMLATQARLLWAELRPGAAPAGALRVTALAQTNLNALLDQAALTHGKGWRAQLQLEPQRLVLRAQQPLKALPLWMNIELGWDLSPQAPGTLPPLQHARLGRLPLPAAWVESMAGRWLQPRGGSSLRELLPMLKAAQASPQQLTLLWSWQPEAALQALLTYWGPDEKAALLAQRRTLQVYLQGHPAGHGIALTQLMRALAVDARQRIAKGQAAPEAELRALIVQLSLLSLGRDLGAWMPEAAAQGPVSMAVPLLAQRDDMPMHFLLAALLSWDAGPRVTTALGLAKELADARVGSGFSFNDLAADEAGNRFGQLCATSPAWVLQRLAEGLKESDFFPNIQGLPEFMPEAEFRRRYGAVGSPAYEQVMAEVQQRLAQIPLYRSQPAP